MCRRFVLAAALVLVAAPAVPAADPPIVFQTQPVGRLLAEVRNTVRTLGGDKAVLGFNALLKQRLGDKGFDGLDLGRPIVGYVHIADKPEESVGVVAFPVTNEPDFLDLCERLNMSKPTKDKNGLIELPSLDTGLVAKARVHNGYAYIATAMADPSPALDAKALIPVPTLFDPAEQSLITAKLHFDRVPASLRMKLHELVGQLGENGIGDALPELDAISKKVFAEFGKLGKRYLDLSKDAKLATLRVNLNSNTADLTAEFALTPLPGTALAKEIAARQPTTNRFGGLVTPDAAVGVKVRLPFFAPEIRNAAVIALEELEKLAAQSADPDNKESIVELTRGLARTVKTGEFDIAGSIRGPDKDGHFTLVGAIAFEDPAALEKAFRKTINALPDDDMFKKGVKWDAAKVGTVNIHTIKITEPDLFFNAKTFGEQPTLAIAFTPRAIFIAVGQDPIPLLKEALDVKPAPAPVLDVVINPARLGKLAATSGRLEDQAEIQNAFGSEDKPFSLMSLSVEGGTELKVRFAISLKIIPREALTAEEAKPLPEKK